MQKHFKPLFDFSTNIIYIKEHIESNHQIIINHTNYLEINDLLVMNGKPEIIFKIGGLMVFSNDSIIMGVKGSEVYKRSCLVYDWIIKNRYTFDNDSILVPGIQYQFSHYCYYLNRNGIIIPYVLLFDKV